MNKHCGRWVFSKIRGCLMVVAEAAKGQGKSGGTRGERPGRSAPGRQPWARAINTLALSAMLTQTTLAPLSAYAQIRNDSSAPGNQRPTVLTTGNGLPQLNITTPSAAGISRNRLSQMDVDNRGAVVNNSRTNTSTQIGGWVQGNPWLATGEAQVILLEVNSQNPSQINGFLEIAGQRSEIIVANPAGLNVNGSGFINASRATLTTGEVNVNEAGVSGYTVRGGTITIGSQGFDASLTDYTGILARAIAVNGPLVANELNLVVGANQIDASAHTATPTAASGPAPRFALDVSQLGGMYAGKITLLATEAGVGVRNAGGVQAGAGGLSLSANGDLINQGSLASQGSASLSNSGRFDNSGSLGAASALNVQSGGALNNSGQIRSGGALSLHTQADLNNAGHISAGTDASIVADGRLDNTGEVSAGANLDLQSQQLSNTGHLNAGQQLSLSSAGRFDNAGQIVVQGTIELRAPQGITNTGSIQSQRGITLTSAADLSNSGTVQADGALAVQASTIVVNTGSLMGDQSVTIQGAQRIDNQGDILSGGSTLLNAEERLDNGGLIVGDGDMQLRGGQRIDNRGGAQIHAGGNLQALSDQAILNEGRIGAGGDTRLQTLATDGRIESTAGSVLSAGMDSSGAVPLGHGSLSLQGGSAGSIELKGLTLAGAQIQASAGSIDLRGQELLSQRIDLQASQGDLRAQDTSLQAVQQLRLGATGQLRTEDATLGATELDVTANEWDLQRARLQQTGTGATHAQVQVANRIDASGATIAANAGSLTLASQELQLNQTTLTHAGSGDLVLKSQGAQTVVADDALLSSAGSLQLEATALQANRSVISAQGNAHLNIQGAMTASEATIVANGALDIQAASLSAERANLVGVEGDATLTIAAGANLREGSVQSRANVVIDAGSLDSSQGLISGQDIHIDTHGGALGNADGTVLATRHLSVLSGAIDNQRGVLQAGANATIAAGGGINNQAGQILAGGTLELTGNGVIDNRSAAGVRAAIASGAALSLNAQGLLNQGSDIKSAARIDLNADILGNGAGAVDNSQGALIATSGALALRSGNLDNRQTRGPDQGIQAQSVSLSVQGLDNRDGALLAQDGLDITASGTLDNSGGLLSSTTTLSIRDPQATANPSAKTLLVLNGAGGVIASNGATDIDARSLDNSGVIANAGDTSGGSLAAGSGDLRIALTGTLDNRAGGTVQAAGNLNASASAATNAGTLEAASELHLGAGSIHNQSTGAVRAGLIDLQAASLSNQGLINGGFTLLQAGTIDNTNGGRIYGDQISIAANQVTNRGGAGTDPVIASRGDLDLGVGVVSNTEGALLLSLGDTRVGSGLDANARATGSAGAFTNSSADVEVFGNLTINAASVQNVDAHGESYSHTTTEHIREYLPLDPDHPQYLLPLSDATGDIDWRLEYDEQYRADYIPDDGSPVIAANQWLVDEYDRTTTESGNSGHDPARISVGGNMTVNAGNTVNDKSSILIGGNFLLSGGSLQNIDGFRSRTVTEDNGTSYRSYTEERWYDWHHRQRRFFTDPVERVVTPVNEYEAISATLAVHTNPNHGSARPQDAQAVSVASHSASPTASTTSTGTSSGPVLGQPGPGVVVRTLPSGLGSGPVSGLGATAAASVNAPPISLPSNALFQVRVGAPAGFLVETDPEFTQRRTWLGSDFMLTQLDYDPATQTQRLGDGFYEQKLVREQVAQLTGRRFLGSFTDDEAQYRALLEAGVAFAKAYSLKPGIALTREQMALLTSDIVWLVERSVTLPDGRVQRVLVPQLYALVDPSTPTLSAGLISAKGMDINLSGGLFNAGTLAARENLAINAGSITNVLGQMQGQNIDLRASGGITSILGQIAARQNLAMKAGGDMVFVGGGIKAGGNARLSAGGDLQLLAYDTGKQVRAQSARDEDGKPVGKGPEWSVERSTYNQTGVDIQVGGSLKASAGKNLVAQGVNAKVGGSTSLSAGQDMQLTTALKGHVNTNNFFNRYKHSGGLIKIEQRIDSRDIDLTNSGNSWNSGGSMNLKAGGNLSLVGAQIKSQGYQASAGKNYEERAAYDVKEQVNVQSIKKSGAGVYLRDFNNNMLALATLGDQGGRSETARTETHIDSTRTAIVTNIDAGSGAVGRRVGGDAFIEGSVIRGGQGKVEPLKAGGKVTQVAAMDTRHVEDSVFTSTIRWQSTKSKGQIEQTIHMPEIHGLPEGVSAYQGAGGVSVQLPAGSRLRQTIETLSQEPGKGYLKELGNRSDIDWQRVEVLNQSLDFSKSGLTQEATIAVIIVVSILTYGAASSAGGAAATTVGASSTGAVATAFTAGFSSLASTAAVSLINNKGDIGAVLKELGSEDNAKGLLLTMATAGLTQGILDAIPLEGGGTLAGVNANSSVELLLAKNTIQGISSAVLESAVMGTSLEDALKNNLQGALINTVAAKGADSIGDAASKGTLDSTSKALAHALLGCAVGTATAGSSSGCAPGATGAVIGEIVAGMYGDSQHLGDLEDQLAKDPTNAALKQQVDQIRNTVTELAKLTGAGGALLIGGDASTMQIAMGTANNAAVNNFLNHAESSERQKLKQEQLACTSDTCRQDKQVEIDRLNKLDAWRDEQIEQACKSPASAACQGWTSAIQSAAASYQGQYGNLLDTAERSSVLNQAFKYQQAVNNPFLHGVGQGLLKLTPPGLAVGAIGGAAAAVQSVVENGPVQAVIDAAIGLSELPESLRTRLNSSDPSEVGEALVDVFALGSGATLTAAGGTRLVLNQVERSKINTALAQAEARARVENNFNAENDGWSNKPSGLNETTPVKDTFGKAPNDSDLATHLSTGGPSTQKGVFGAHADAAYQTELTSVGGIEISKTEIAPGVWERQYNTPDRIAAGKAPLTKTTYDARWSDQQILEMSKQASSQAWTEFQRTGVQPGVTTQINGIPFVTLFSKDKSGNIAVYSHPGKAKP